MDLVSIVIPVYNTGEPMRACLDSVLAQTYTNLEILLVDDHSTDQLTLDLLHEYVRKDSRFTLLTSSENNGLPATRNIGINHANGKHITFLDSDDQFDPDFVERMHDAVAKNDTDFAVCHIKQFVLDDSVPLDPDFVFPMIGTNKVETSLFLKEKMLMNIPISACGKLVNLQKLKQKNLYFVEEMRYAEDHDWCYRLFCALESFSVVNFYGIKRLLRSNSMIHTIKERELFCVLRAYDLKYKVLLKYGWFALYRRDFFDNLSAVVDYCLKHSANKDVQQRLLLHVHNLYLNMGIDFKINPNQFDYWSCWLLYQTKRIFFVQDIKHRAMYKIYKKILKAKQQFS